MFATIRTAAAAVLTAALMTAAVGTTHAVDYNSDPLNCSSRVTGTLSANPQAVNSGAAVTVSWSVSEPALCAGEANYRVGTAFSSSTGVGKTGSRTYYPTATTTYRLWADFGGHQKVLSSKTVYVGGEIPVKVQLGNFNAVRAQEQGGNGDEPWLMVFPIFADGTTIDVNNPNAATVRVFSATRAHRNLNRVNVYNGAQFAVPADTGTFSTTMKPWRGLPTSLGKKASMVGLAVIALEEDGTPDSAATAGKDTAKSEIAKRVADVVKNAIKTQQAPTTSDLQQVQSSVQSAVVATMTRETLLSFGLAGVIDPDDFIGAGFVKFSQEEIEAAGSTGRTFTFTFNQDGADYRVGGKIFRG